MAVQHVPGRGRSHPPPRRLAAEAASDESEPESQEKKARRKAKASINIIQRNYSTTRKPIPMPKSRIENTEEAEETETAEDGDKRSAAGSDRTPRTRVHSTKFST